MMEGYPGFRASWPESTGMYHRGGDRGWHGGPHQGDIPAQRHPHHRPYGGGYHEQREHGNYGSYHDSPCNDRNYSNNEFMEYPERVYHNYQEEDRSCKEYREHREPSYHRGGRPNKFSHYRGGYQRSRGESSRYQNKTPETQHKRYDYKPAKTSKKENEVREKSSTPKPFQTVSHNSGRVILTLTDCSSENENETKSKSPTQEITKDALVCEKPSQENAMAAQVCEKASQESAQAAQVCEKAAQVCEKPTQESVKAAQVSQKLSPDCTKTVQDCPTLSQGNGKAAQVCQKPTQGSAKSQDYRKPSQVNVKTAPICEMPSKESVKMTNVTKSMDQAYDKNVATEKGPSACETKTVIIESKTEILQAQPSIKQQEMPLRLNTGKRAHSEEKDLKEEEKSAEISAGKRIRKSKDVDERFSQDAVHIPLLGGFSDTSPKSMIPTNGQEKSVTAVDYGISDSVQELRTAYILAKKEEIELAFSQDCKTFACVASLLTKRDPSIETAVTSSLRSTLQDMAGRCVQELSNYIEHYDNLLVDTSNRLQESDK